jgi:hypothetical protein
MNGFYFKVSEQRVYFRVLFGDAYLFGLLEMCEKRRLERFEAGLYLDYI